MEYKQTVEMKVVNKEGLKSLPKVFDELETVFNIMYSLAKDDSIEGDFTINIKFKKNG